MKLQDVLYAVEITRKDGTKFLAGGGVGSVYALYFWHRQAMNFCRNLREHIEGKARVVRVNSEVLWEDQL